MFDRLHPPEPDAIIRLMQQFRDDPRPDKVDLGVGVYRDAQGRTPVMRAIKDAEARILADQDSKTYVALAGDAGFLSAMRGLVLGGAVPGDRIGAAATPGGTGAVRQILDLVRMVSPGATVHLPDPTWPNHPAIVETVGLRQRSYRYYDGATGTVDVAGMLDDLDRVAAGDVVLLHACCHNPTGADLALRDWADVAAVLERRQAVPFVDIAYQGFGEGLDADAAGLRHLAARLPEVLVAASGSKTFGVYRDRVGMAMAICADPAAATRTGAALAWLNRQSFAFPPDHGARAVTLVLDDPALRASWTQELETMRQRIAANRAMLSRLLTDRLGSDRFGFLTGHRGMFSRLGLAPDAVARLRSEFGIYLVGDGRANLAGLTEPAARRVAEALGRILPA